MNLSFKDWLNERGIRTSLGIYPPEYGSGQYPALYFAPISGGHANAFALVHGDEHKELLSEPIKKQWEKNKKIKKQPEVKDVDQ